MYHGIQDTEHDPGGYDNNYSVTVMTFKDHLKYIQENKYTSILLNELNNIDSYNKPLIITFDDGDKSNISTALPILREFGMKAEFFVTTGRIGIDKSALDETDIQRLSDAGMSIQSHGVTHKFLTGLSDLELDEELIKSKSFIESLTNIKVKYLSLPGGRGGSREIAMARKLGYEAICTSTFGVNTTKLDQFRLKRITIYRDTTVNKLAKMMNRRGVYYWVLVTRKMILDVTKILLGNNIYHQLHLFITKAKRACFH